MSTGATLKRSTPSEMADIVSGEKREVLLEQFRDSVSKRAYELFEQLGRSDGQDLSHWLRAEAELCQRLSEVHESGAWYTVTTPVVGVPADHIKISIEDNDALIAAEKIAKSEDDRAQEQRSAYYAVRWPESVNPETGSAYLKNGTLTLVARKAAADGASQTPAEAERPLRQRNSSKRSKR